MSELTYREETDGTWTVLCDYGHIIEEGYLALHYAVAEVSAEDCTGCAERVAEADSGIPRGYAEP
jgi:hypothetical protein